MKLEHFPNHIRDFIVPRHQGSMVYQCLGCEETFGIESLYYTCPKCRQVLLLVDQHFDQLKSWPPSKWQEIFEYRKMVDLPALKGIYRYHEFLGPVVSLDSVVYLGEAHTPIVEANKHLQKIIGVKFYLKNDGQNPSASFKDRGMASALSYINFLVKGGMIDNVLAICASTGDTSAAAALYSAYLRPNIKSAVLLPHKKVTPQQLSQPLGNGAVVFEIPGVFDDCMKVVERLSEIYNVALLNSKNAWRILGQESYAYEIAQEFNYELKNAVIVVPIGNAGNITAIMQGFLKFFDAGIITHLPKIIGVQSEHANPVYRYYMEKDINKRRFEPIEVRPSVAQAAMIGNPVSMPRVIHSVALYNQKAGKERVGFFEVTEQSIMDWQIIANQNGNIACTHGGECLAGLKAAIMAGWVLEDEFAIIDSTAHALKFQGFQEMYFDQSLPSAYGIRSNRDLINQPTLLEPDTFTQLPRAGKSLEGTAMEEFVSEVTSKIARQLNLSRK